MMESSGIAILVLIGVALVEGAVLGIWIWALRRRAKRLQGYVCSLENEARGLKRSRALADEQARREALTDEEFTAEYNRDLDDGS